MKSSWLLTFALAISSAIAGQPASTSPAGSDWQNWVTVTETKTEYKTSVSVSVSVSYVTVPVSIPGPVTTIKQTVTETKYITQAPSTATVTVTSSVTVNSLVTQPASTVTVTTTVPQTIVQQSTVAVTAIVTTVSISTVSTVRTVTQSALNGLVTCESRIVNPTYTPPAPLPSNYLWGCPPGKLCYPPRENCNFEQGVPARSYVCKPEDCRPVAAIPPINVFLAANQYKNNGTCAFITPVDDYFNLSPLQFGLNYGIFNIFGQSTCTSTATCPPPKTVTVKNDVTIAQTVPVPTTLTVVKTNAVTIEVTKPITIEKPSPVTIVAEKSSSTWDAWQGSPQPPKVTKKASLEKRQLQALIAYAPCYALCNYANYKWQSIGDNFDNLCPGDSDYINAYNVALDCNSQNAAAGATGSIITDLDVPRSICNQGAVKKRWGRANAW